MIIEIVQALPGIVVLLALLGACRVDEVAVRKARQAAKDYD